MVKVGMHLNIYIDARQREPRQDMMMQLTQAAGEGR